MDIDIDGIIAAMPAMSADKLERLRKNAEAWLKSEDVLKEDAAQQVLDALASLPASGRPDPAVEEA